MQDNFIEIKNKMIEINKLLKKASKAYYQEKKEIMTNLEYDKLYDELVNFEEQYGVLEDSVTQQVGSDVVSELTKRKHEHKALSLNKTKDKEELLEWLDNNEGILSWKLDGLTLVLTYQNGNLQYAVTRGNGEIGEDVTHNAIYFEGIPAKIDYKGKLILRGEAFISYSEFKRINEEKESDKYLNPRNLASGTIRMLNSNESRKRKVIFNAFELVYLDKPGIFKEDTYENRFYFLKSLGFNVVEHKLVNKNNLLKILSEYENKIKNNDFPSDGLVLFYNDIKYGLSLGTTNKFPRNGKAFKWCDEEKETTIKNITWETSRTGLINPVVNFDKIELEGTNVSSATGNNLSYMKNMKLSVGSIISVYKANMIIPTISKNIKPFGKVEYPNKCPSCNAKTEIHVSENEIETLHCPNKNCPAKLIKRYSHFVERNAMNIVGISEAKLEKLLNNGFIQHFDDIFKLEKYKNEIVNLEGFGLKSFENIIKEVEKSKEILFENFLYSIGIPNIGISTAKDISKILNENKYEDFCYKLKNGFDFTTIDGIGTIVNESIYKWYNDDEKFDEFKNVAKELKFKIEEKTTNELNGKIFVITGNLEKFANRKDLIEQLVNKGAKVTSSISNNTNYLINNDIKSNSSKNKKAKELNIEIITEDELINRFFK